MKSLLYEAYHKGARELLYVVPFTAKILESCAKSKVSIAMYNSSIYQFTKTVFLPGF